ncbi:MAG TPA: hypothetical protein VMT67_03300 [Terriglobales bacterium]|nr:hypothetical protein [Terriglobales bacterium]
MADTQLTMEDYLAMARRRLTVVLVPLLIAPVAGFLVSYGFKPKYNSQAIILVEGQKVPSNLVEPVVTSDFAHRVQTLSAEMVSTTKLRPMIQDLDLAKPGEERQLIEDIRSNLQLTPGVTSMSQAEATAGLSGKKKANSNDVSMPSVNVSYSDTSPDRAQKICNAMVQAIINENLKNRADIAKQTTTFLGRQVEDAKTALDDQDAKIAEFKKRYAGQLPGDLENNMRVLSSLNTQLDATTQSLNRAQQDKAYAESMLAQQLSAWKSSQSSANPQTLQQQLAALQAQLLQLQARYTDDYPDVIKTKADISKVQAKLDEIDKQASNASTSTEKANVNEPPEIRQLRLQIHQYQQVIEQSAADQKRLQASINSYEARTSMSPDVEEQWKVLSRDNESAQKFYNDLLTKKSSADLGVQMETTQEGEQLTVGQPASHPEQPAFPNRLFFMAGGLGAGLGLGCLMAIWLEFSDKSIRTERDAAVAMDLPLLISVPWVGEEEHASMNGHGNGNGKRHFWGRTAGHHDEVGV